MTMGLITDGMYRFHQIMGNCSIKINIDHSFFRHGPYTAI